MESGIFIVDKPLNITSNQLVQQVKKKFSLTKVGHAGTLDPLATGVMIILVNQATKLSDLLLNETKQYQVGVKLYSSTTTGDVEGEVIETKPNLNLTKQDVDQVLKKYQNYTYDQIPPIYSAIKKDGKKLYEYARANQSVDIKPRKVTIIDTKLLSFDDQNQEFEFATTVSKGTYIRSLVVDLAADLNTVGHLNSLRRTASGSFNLDQASLVEDLTMKNLITPLKVVEQLGFKQYNLTEQEYNQVIHGQKLHLNLTDDEVFVVYDHQLIALYKKENETLYRCVKNNLS